IHLISLLVLLLSMHGLTLFSYTTRFRSIAGPSEILVVCDGDTDPDWIAMDLFSQAEHDEEAQAILVSPDAEFLEQVLASMATLAPTLGREAIIRTSMPHRGTSIAVQRQDEAI